MVPTASDLTTMQIWNVCGFGRPPYVPYQKKSIWGFSSGVHDPSFLRANQLPLHIEDSRIKSAIYTKKCDSMIGS